MNADRKADLAYLGWACAGTLAGLALVVLLSPWLATLGDLLASVVGVAAALSVASLGAWIGIRREERAYRRNISPGGDDQ